MTKAIFIGHTVDTINSTDTYTPGMLSVDSDSKSIIVYDGKTPGGIKLITKGENGATGPQGPAGIQGAKGDTGEAGPQGVAGTAGVGIKGFASGYVNAGQFVTLDNLKFSVTTAGNRGLSCATVSGTVTLSIASTYSVVGGANGSSNQWPGSTYTTTPQGPWFGYHFPNAGDGSVYLANDYTNGRVYRITLLIGLSYNNNFISIERLI